MFEDVIGFARHFYIIKIENKSISDEIHLRIKFYINRGYIDEKYKNRPLRLKTDKFKYDHVYDFLMEEPENSPDDYSMRIRYQITEIVDPQGLQKQHDHIIGNIYIETDDYRYSGYDKLAITLEDDVNPSYLGGKFLVDLARKLDEEFNHLDLKILHERIENDSLGREDEIVSQNNQFTDQNKKPTKPLKTAKAEEWFDYFHEMKKLHKKNPQIERYTLQEMAKDSNISYDRLRKLHHKDCPICAQYKKGTKKEQS